MSLSLNGNLPTQTPQFTNFATYQPETSSSFEPYVAGDGVSSGSNAASSGSPFGSLFGAGSNLGGLGGGGGAGGGSALSSMLGAFMQSITQQLQSVFTMMTQLLGGTQAAQNGQQSGSIGGVPTAYRPPTTASPNEQLFNNATASSTGDPHESFSGTDAGGTHTAGTWDSMRSHGNLLSSDSFAGGYRVSTLVTDPNDKGITLNKSANVSTNGGATNVAMHGDGSYNVTSSGQAVALHRGQAVALGNGESVTLNADSSLTVSDTSASGGSISTTLKTNGSGGVDVSNSAQNVDLGGYLVRHAEAAQQGQVSSSGATAGPAYPAHPLADPIDPASYAIA